MTFNTFCRQQFSGYGDNTQLDKINPDSEEVDTQSFDNEIMVKWTNLVNQGA